MLLDKRTLFLGAALLFLAWAITATVYAVNNAKSRDACNRSLRASYSGLDSCYKFCGSKGNWAPGQLSAESDCITNLLTKQNLVACDNPADYQKLVSCAVGAVSQQNSYWDVSNPSNMLSGVAIVSDALSKCVPSVPGCKPGTNGAKMLSRVRV